MKGFISVGSNRLTIVAGWAAWAAFALPTASALAFSSEQHAMPKQNASAQAQESVQLSDTQQNDELIEGEIKKIDKSASKLTIKHGDIKKFDMPGMTMSFRLKEIAMLDNLNVGDKVRFSVEKIAGGLVLTRVERLQ